MSDELKTVAKLLEELGLNEDDVSDQQEIIDVMTGQRFSQEDDQ